MASKKPKLLAGGNPQIPKGEGDAPVQAYLDAMPGWKQDVGRRLDRLIVEAVPDVHKAVKWNTPFYGVEGKGWFVGFHCYPRSVKVTFFRGTSLDPVPPGTSKTAETRYLDVGEDDDLDEAQFTDWIRQARRLPLERLRPVEDRTVALGADSAEAGAPERLRRGPHDRAKHRLARRALGIGRRARER